MTWKVLICYPDGRQDVEEQEIPEEILQQEKEQEETEK